MQLLFLMESVYDKMEKKNAYYIDYGRENKRKIFYDGY